MSERRKFIKGFGLFGAVLAGAASAKVVIEEKKKPVEDISDLAPDYSSVLVLHGNRLPPKEPIPHSGFYIMSNAEYANKVSLAVGRDNRLWIKSGDYWKRVSIEE